MELRNLAIYVSGVLGLSILACAGPQTVDSGPVQLVASGESFTNLTVITDNVVPSRRAAISEKGEVVFASSKDGNWDLYLKPNATAKALRKLSNHGATDQHPSLSPDGNQVAFASNRSGNSDIFILRTDGGTAKQQVTDSNDDEILPDFSPDGTMIAYSRYSAMDGQFYIWTKNLQTDANVQIAPGLNPQFSPDGKTILFQKAANTGNRYFGLWLMDLNGGRMTELISSQDWGAIQASWSPDGKKIVFATSKGLAGSTIAVRTTDANGQQLQQVDVKAGINLWVMGNDGSALTQLTTHQSDDTWPVWTDDNFIYFSSLRDGKEKIWRFTPQLPDGYVPAVAAPEVAEPAVETPETTEPTETAEAS